MTINATVSRRRPHGAVGTNPENTAPAEGDGIMPVYFVQGTDGGPIKIGSSIDPKARVNEIQM